MRRVRSDQIEEISAPSVRAAPVPDSAQLLRLARVQHWRKCPQCAAAVEFCTLDGNAICNECGKDFRWLDADLVVPVASLKELRNESKWAYEERRHNGNISMKDVAKRYWLSRDKDHAPLTRTAGVELALWRAAISAPLAVALPFMTVSERMRRRKEEAVEEGIRRHNDGAAQSGKPSCSSWECPFGVA